MRSRSNDVAELVARVRERGASLRVEGERLLLRPRSAAGPELLQALRARKMEIISYLEEVPLAKQPPQPYRLKYEDHVQASEAELQEIEVEVERNGFILLWSRVLEDLVAFFRDEEARKKVPLGFVCYSEQEMQKLFGAGSPPLSRHDLMAIHEAKKQGVAIVADDVEERAGKEVVSDDDCIDPPKGDSGAPAESGPRTMDGYEL